tara:strand:- start:118 stop:414 length:297 start_codon:yes stop_codon:yes gene_type:complete
MNPVCFISYEGRKGNLFIESNKVEFCGTIFSNICSAITVLKQVRGIPNLAPYYYKKYRGFTIDTGEVVVDTQESKGASWFTDTEYADLYCSTLLKNKY